MKSIVSKATRDQNGKVLIMVLVLLVVGGLVLTPLLGLMSTGLVAGQVYERKLHEYYAADAGVEDALWRIEHGEEILPGGYPLKVNGIDVWVTVETKDTTQFLVELLDIEEKNWPHSDWNIVGSISEPGKAKITIEWEGSGNAFLTDVGLWISDAGGSYVEGQTIDADDIRADYTDYVSVVKDYQGTAFIWTWPNANQNSGPSFSNQNRIRTLTFYFLPDDAIPASSVTFTMAGRQDVGLSHDGGFESHSITAVATTDSESQTTVVAGAARRGCKDDSEMVVFAWNIS